MPNYGVQKSSIAAVLNWFNNQSESRFAIYRGNKPNDAYLTGSYHGSDKEESANVLEQMLSDIEANDYNVYFLKLLPDNAKQKNPTPGITFQLFTSNSGAISGTSNQQAQIMHEVLNEIRALRAERLQQIETDDDDDESEDDESLLAGIVKQPQVQQILAGMLQQFLTGNNTQAKALAGVETETDQEAILQQHLQTLFSKGVTVEDFAKLAAMDKLKLKMLLSMLRNG